jgi:hypothetical protein
MTTSWKLTKEIQWWFWINQTTSHASKNYWMKVLTKNWNEDHCWGWREKHASVSVGPRPQADMAAESDKSSSARWENEIDCVKYLGSAWEDGEMDGPRVWKHAVSRRTEEIQDWGSTFTKNLPKTRVSKKNWHTARRRQGSMDILKPPMTGSCWKIFSNVRSRKSPHCDPSAKRLQLSKQA